MFDIDNTGKISPFELKETMDAMNMKDKNPVIYSLISSLCTDEYKEGITSDDFISYITEKMSEDTSEEGIRRIFDIFTEPNSETISLSNFVQAAKELREDVTEKELKDLLEKAKASGNELTFEEFYNIMINGIDVENMKNVSSLTELREMLLRNNPDLSKITIPSDNNSDNNNEVDPKFLSEIGQYLEKTKSWEELFEKISEAYDEIDMILQPEEIINRFMMYIALYTSKVYHIYCSIKPLLTEQDSSVLEWYLASSEYYKWYNSIMSSTKTVPISDYNISDSLGIREISDHAPDSPHGEDKQPIYNFVLKEPLSESELETLYNCLVDKEFIDMGTPIENLIHVLGGPRPKDYKAVRWIKKTINKKICKKSVLNLMVYLVGNWDDIISSSTRKDWLNRLNYCFVAGDTPFSFKNLKDSKSYNNNDYNAQSEADEQLLNILGEVFGTDSERYSRIKDTQLIKQAPTNNEMV